MANQGTYTITNPSVDTVPASSTLAGTWTAAANQKALTGTNGTATTQTQPGWWIYDVTNSRIAQVAEVVSDNLIYLVKGLPNAQSGATLRRITKPGLKKAGIRSSGGITTLTDANGSTSTYDDTEGINLPLPVLQHRLVTPYVVSPAASTSAQITYQL
jgi:hypothetical protein